MPTPEKKEKTNRSKLNKKHIVYNSPSVSIRVCFARCQTIYNWNNRLPMHVCSVSLALISSFLRLSLHVYFVSNSCNRIVFTIFLQNLSQLSASLVLDPTAIILNLKINTSPIADQYRSSCASQLSLSIFCSLTQSLFSSRFISYIRNCIPSQLNIQLQ